MAKQLCVDMDGFLVDFQREMLRRHNTKLPYEKVEWDFWKQMGITKEQFWSVATREWWANLPWTPEGEAALEGLVRIAGKENITLLSSPSIGGMDGKEDWVRKHIPEFRNQMFLGSEKWRFAGPDKCLIDDSDQNCIEFRGKGGGSYILVPRPWNLFKDKTNPDGTFKIRQLLSDVRKWWNG